MTPVVSVAELTTVGIVMASEENLFVYSINLSMADNDHEHEFVGAIKAK